MSRLGKKRKQQEFDLELDPGTYNSFCSVRRPLLLLVPVVRSSFIDFVTQYQKTLDFVAFRKCLIGYTSRALGTGGKCCHPALPPVCGCKKEGTCRRRTDRPGKISLIPSIQGLGFPDVSLNSFITYDMSQPNRRAT